MKDGYTNQQLSDLETAVETYAQEKGIEIDAMTRNERACFYLAVGLLLETAQDKKQDGSPIIKIFGCVEPAHWELRTQEHLYRKKD